MIILFRPRLGAFPQWNYIAPRIQREFGGISFSKLPHATVQLKASHLNALTLIHLFPVQTFPSKPNLYFNSVSQLTRIFISQVQYFSPEQFFILDLFLSMPTSIWEFLPSISCVFEMSYTPIFPPLN